MGSTTGIINAQGVTMDVSPEVRQDLIRVMGNALLVASALAPNEEGEPLMLGHLRPAMLGLATSAAFHSVNTLFSAVSLQCNLALPPQDIGATMNAAGKIVLRCYHSPAHEWSLDGNPIP
jgi:hypothetical protein